MLALGAKTEIEKLRDFLKNQEETVGLLSQGIFGIYKPEEPRYPGNDKFGGIPGSLSPEVTVWPHL